MYERNSTLTFGNLSMDPLRDIIDVVEQDVGRRPRFTAVALAKAVTIRRPQAHHANLGSILQIRDDIFRIFGRRVMIRIAKLCIARPLSVDESKVLGMEGKYFALE